MILKKILISVMVFAIMLSFSVSFGAQAKNEYYNDFVRLHIRAASDSKSDQDLKLKVRDAVLAFTTENLHAENMEDAEDKIIESLEAIRKICLDVLKENGSDEDVSVSFDDEFFDYREYEGFFLPEGVYKSLIIEIGEGKGKNWWCVVYPAVCLSGSSAGESDSPEKVTVSLEKVPNELKIASTPTNEEIKFEFWIVGAIKKLLAFFS